MIASSQARIFLQFANSERLQKLAQGFVNINDVTETFEWFYILYNNLESAAGVGLDWWGDKLSWPRNRIIENTTPETLDDEQYRLFLRMLFIKTFTAPTMPNFLNALDSLFGVSDKIGVSEVSPMVITVTSLLVLKPWEKQLLGSRDFLPVPMGVQYGLIIIPGEYYLGFEGSGLTNFEDATFFPQRIIT